MNANSSGFLNAIPPVTKNLIIINIIVWLAQMVALRSGIDLSEILGLHYVESPGFRFWQPVTYVFLHDTGSFLHVFSNMFAVFMFGRTLEQIWGGKRFLGYYFLTGLGAAITQLLVIYIRLQSAKHGMDAESVADVYSRGYDLLLQNMNYVDDAKGAINLMLNTVTIGASGAVFGILLAFGMLFPNAELFIIPIPFPIKAKYFVVLYGIVEFSFGVAQVRGDNVAHFAHLGGMLFGIFLILYWKKKRKIDGRFY